MNIYLFFLLVLFKSFAQIQNGKIVYGLEMVMPVQLTEQNMLQKSYTEAIENSQFLSFTLNFNSELSYFIINDAIGKDDYGYFYAKLFSGYKGEVYQNKSNSLSVIGGPFGNFILKKDTNNWELVNESKEIEGFICYKALSEKVVVNYKKTSRYPVVAWYCPKIPISYGPNGYGDLPGLILELQVRNVVYGAKKVQFNLQKSSLIPEMKDYKIITEKELDEIIREHMSNSKKTFVKPSDKF